MTDTTLEWNNVNYSIRQGFLMKPVNIIRDLSLKIPKGFSLGLVGPNGAGKTTTIKLAAGILKPDTGFVSIDGKSVFASSIRSKIGFLTESQYIPPYLKLGEWLEMLGSLSGLPRKYLKKRVPFLLDKFELTHKTDTLLSAMSKGETQRAGFVQAFLHEPEILILDEPMSGLDPLWRANIHDILMEFKKSGGTLLFSSHIMSDVERLSDRIAMIASGSIQWEGSFKDLPVIEKKYQVVFNINESDPQMIERIKSTFHMNHIERQPDGSFFVKLDHVGKKQLIALASQQDEISIDSLTSVYPSFKDMFK
ncbi:ABC transporter ATP-binding protein [Desulfocicer niacini]